jgi:hypothetical protein
MPHPQLVSEVQALMRFISDELICLKNILECKLKLLAQF